MITFTAAPGIDVIASEVAIPGLGVVPANAFVLHASEPVLVDTGLVTESDEFMDALRSLIDIQTIRWIWLTHTDFDHTGSLHRLLNENAQLRVITSYLGVGIMGLSGTPLPIERAYMINDRQTITVGDRTLTAVKPPTFDNPVTTGFHDDASGAFFSADSFGALLQSVPQNAADLTADELRTGQVTWTTADSPWIHKVDPALLAKECNGIREMAPSNIFSAHLPPAPGTMIEQLIASIEAAPNAEPFCGPDQMALQQMLCTEAS